MTTITRAVFPYKDEHAVAHLGTAKVCGQDGFQTVWVIDSICPTPELAVQCMNDLIRQDKVRSAQMAADMIALARRR